MNKFELIKNKSLPVAVVGLGYVGLPLAVALARHFHVIGFDISETRIAELKSGQDHTREVTPENLRGCGIEFSSAPADLGRAGVIIVAVPTPIDEHHNPDLRPLESASRSVGRNMKAGATVVYESTVYPGMTEEFCVPILEKESGLAFGRDFTVGYSPERINPGDKVHTLESVVKIVSGSNAETAELLAAIYGSVVKAGIHKAPCIKVAEAAKVIENTQRDLNIALMNELALIFNLMGIDTQAVLEAAGTKWNFLRFSPGLVGGHCIGVDPYYLTFKAEEYGYNPQVILAGRRINDSMGKFVAHNAIKKLIQAGSKVKGAKVGIMGLTFKENVPDLRNTRVVDIIAELEEFGIEVLVHDPEAYAGEAEHECGLVLRPFSEFTDLDAVIAAVAHASFLSLPMEQLKKCFRADVTPVLIDVKGVFTAEEAEKNGISRWTL